MGFSHLRRTHRIVLLCTALFLAFTVGACSSDHDTAAPVVEGLSYTRLQSGARIVSGELFNPSDHPIAGAQIQVSLFDGSNTRVGSVSIAVQNIPAQGRVSFRHPLDTDADVQAARVRSVIIL